MSILLLAKLTWSRANLSPEAELGVSTREQVLEAVAHLTERQLEEALLYLRAITASGGWPSLAAAPFDDEPYSDTELREDAETLRRLDPSDLLTTEQLSRELGL